MNGDKLPQDMLNFSKKITESVSDLVQNVVQNIIDLKQTVISEYLNALPSENHDIGLMIKIVSKYCELKGYIKHDIKLVLNKLLKQWIGQLDSMRSSVLAELETKVQSYDLQLSDFSVPSYNPPLSPSFVNWHNSIINSAFPNDVNGTGFLKRKRSSFSNASPSELVTKRKKSQRSAGPVLELPFDVSYEDEEMENEGEQTAPPPVVSAKTSPTKRQTAEQPARGRSSCAASHTPPVCRGRRSRSQSLTPLRTRVKKNVPESTLPVAKAPVGKFPKDASPMSYSNIEPDDTHSALWNHSMWYLLSAISEKVNIPEMPAVYQVKVKQAKKCAYIGVCDNLRSTLMGYKNGESSGLKQLDKYIDRNRNSIEIQCLVCSSFNVADLKRANQLAVFRKNFFKNPAYNV